MNTPRLFCRECGHLLCFHGSSHPFLCTWQNPPCSCSGVVVNLTFRELEVLKLIGCGYNVKEVGLKLNIATKTAITHLHTLSQKLRLHSKVDIILYCFKNKILTIDDIPEKGMPTKGFSLETEDSLSSGVASGGKGQSSSEVAKEKSTMG